MFRSFTTYKILLVRVPQSVEISAGNLVHARYIIFERLIFTCKFGGQPSYATHLMQQMNTSNTVTHENERQFLLSKP
jgi:hypothetical protein